MADFLLDYDANDFTLTWMYDPTYVTNPYPFMIKVNRDKLKTSSHQYCMIQQASNGKLYISLNGNTYYLKNKDVDFTLDPIPGERDISEDSLIVYKWTGHEIFRHNGVRMVDTQTYALVEAGATWSLSAVSDAKFSSTSGATSYVFNYIGFPSLLKDGYVLPSTVDNTIKNDAAKSIVMTTSTVSITPSSSRLTRNALLFDGEKCIYFQNVTPSAVWSPSKSLWAEYRNTSALVSANTLTNTLLNGQLLWFAANNVFPAARPIAVINTRPIATASEPAQMPGTMIIPSPIGMWLHKPTNTRVDYVTWDPIRSRYYRVVPNPSPALPSPESLGLSRIQINYTPPSVPMTNTSPTIVNLSFAAVDFALTYIYDPVDFPKNAIVVKVNKSKFYTKTTRYKKLQLQTYQSGTDPMKYCVVDGNTVYVLTTDGTTPYLPLDNNYSNLTDTWVYRYSTDSAYSYLGQRYTWRPVDGSLVNLLGQTYPSSSFSGNFMCAPMHVPFAQYESAAKTDCSRIYVRISSSAAVRDADLMLDHELCLLIITPSGPYHFQYPASASYPYLYSLYGIASFHMSFPIYSGDLYTFTATSTKLPKYLVVPSLTGNYIHTPTNTRVDYLNLNEEATDLTAPYLMVSPNTIPTDIPTQASLGLVSISIPRYQQIVTVTDTGTSTTSIGMGTSTTTDTSTTSGGTTTISGTVSPDVLIVHTFIIAGLVSLCIIYAFRILRFGGRLF